MPKAISLEEAIEIAPKAHRGQRRRSGDPYILHPLRVASGVERPNERIAVALHDVIEDSEPRTTLADLNDNLDVRRLRRITRGMAGEWRSIVGGGPG